MFESLKVVSLLMTAGLMVLIPLIVAQSVADRLISVWGALGGYYVVTFLQGWLVWDISKDFPKKEQTND